MPGGSEDLRASFGWRGGMSMDRTLADPLRRAGWRRVMGQQKENDVEVTVLGSPVEGGAAILVQHIDTAGVRNQQISHLLRQKKERETTNVNQ